VSATRWKRHERAIARDLGTARLPNSGRAQPDCRAGGVAYQVKTRRTLPAWLLAAVAQAERDAGDDDLPAVVLVVARQGVKARRFVVLPWDAWVDAEPRGAARNGELGAHDETQRTEPR
jgi:hypothetical protein